MPFALSLTYHTCSYISHPFLKQPRPIIMATYQFMSCRFSGDTIPRGIVPLFHPSISKRQITEHDFFVLPDSILYHLLIGSSFLSLRSESSNFTVLLAFFHCIFPMSLRLLFDFLPGSVPESTRLTHVDLVSPVIHPRFKYNWFGLQLSRYSRQQINTNILFSCQVVYCTIIPIQFERPLLDLFIGPFSLQLVSQWFMVCNCKHRPTLMIIQVLNSTHNGVCFSLYYQSSLPCLREPEGQKVNRYFLWYTGYWSFKHNFLFMISGVLRAWKMWRWIFYNILSSQFILLPVLLL